MSAEIDIEIVQLAGFALVLRMRDEAGEIIDYSDHTAAMQIRGSLDSPPVATLTTANGRIVITPDRMTLRLPAAETRRIQLPNGGIHDIFLTPPSGEPFKLAKGMVAFERAVTR